jgi:hypothetical protein
LQGQVYSLAGEKIIKQRFSTLWTGLLRCEILDISLFHYVKEIDGREKSTFKVLVTLEIR